MKWFLVIVITLAIWPYEASATTCNNYSSSYVATSTSTAYANVPANTIGRTPEYCTTFVKVTDSTTAGEGAGIYDINFPVFSSDNTRLLLTVAGGTNYNVGFWSFDPITLQSTYMGKPTSGACYYNYAQWDLSGNHPKRLLCMPNNTTDTDRRIVYLDTTTTNCTAGQNCITGTPQDLVPSSRLLPALQMTATVNVVSGTVSVSSSTGNAPTTKTFVDSSAPFTSNMVGMLVTFSSFTGGSCSTTGPYGYVIAAFVSSTTVTLNEIPCTVAGTSSAYTISGQQFTVSNFTDFDPQAGNYVGMNVSVNGGANQLITGYNPTGNKFSVPSTAGFSNGQSVVISPTQYNVSGLFSISANGDVLCFGIGDGTVGRGTNRGRFIGAYRQSDDTLKIHRISYAEINFALSSPLHSGTHAGQMSRDGSYCIFSLEGDAALSGNVHQWQPFVANPNPNTGDGKITGPSGNGNITHISPGSDRYYSIYGQTGAYLEYVKFSTPTVETPIFTFPVVQTKPYYPINDYIAASTINKDGIFYHVNMQGDGTAVNTCAQPWTLVSGAIYSTPWPLAISNCSMYLPLISTNNPRVYHNGTILPQTGGDVNTQAQCVTALTTAGAGHWCWDSVDSKLLTWAFGSADMVNKVTDKALQIGSNGCNSSTVISLASSTDTISVVDNFYNSQYVFINDGGNQAVRKINSFVGASGCATLDAALPWTPTTGWTARVLGHIIVPWDQRWATQCVVEFIHNLNTDAIASKIIDCPANMLLSGNFFDSYFTTELDISVSADNQFIAARIPWSPERSDIFIYLNVLGSRALPGTTGVPAIAGSSGLLVDIIDPKP